MLDTKLTSRYDTKRRTQYRTESIRVLQVFGERAKDVSPRVGHVHITVADATWHFVDASGETIIVVELAAGPHKVRFELAGPIHRVIAKTTVEFTFPLQAGNMTTA